jgi:DNA-binding PadR family transcriptional regulator
MQRNKSEVFAPKGLLKMLILKLAAEKPITGIEIMDEIPKMTEDVWKPSPGSVYYLLAEMMEDDLLIQVPTGESGVKRYICSNKGKVCLDSFKVDAKKDLYRQMIILKLLSDLAGNNLISDQIQILSRMVSSS